MSGGKKGMKNRKDKKCYLATDRYEIDSLKMWRQDVKAVDRSWKRELSISHHLLDGRVGGKIRLIG